MFRFFENLVDPYCAYPQTDTPPTKLWPFMRAYSQPFKQVFVWTAVTSIVVALVEIGLIYYMGWVVDALSGDPAQVWQNHGAFLIALALFILVLRPGLHVVNVLLMNNTILPNYGTLFRWRAHRHVLRQSVGWFENDFAGRIANRIMQTPPAAGEAVFQVFDAITFSLAYLLGAWVLLAQADLRLSVPLLGWFLLYGVLIRWTIKRVGPASKASSDARSTVTGRVVDAYTNIHSVKMFAQGNEELGYAKTAIEATRQTFQVEMRISTLMEIGLVVLNGLLIVGVVGWALALWMQGEASIGVVAAATALTLRLNAMTGWIMWALSSFFRQLGVVSEGMETISQPIEMVDTSRAQPLTITEGKVEVQGLSHHYGRQSGGLSDVSFTIRPGEKIGLVGRSGAGKSTLLKLLLRFYDIETGQIMIDGQSVSDVTQDSLRGQIGMVQQEGALLHRSIRDNILYGRADAGDQAMIQAARQAKAHEFILNLQDLEGRTGYDAHVGERGVKLSGGERQRISLARVVLKNAPILLLDEATSALDSEVEAAIQQTLYQMMTGKTVIAIAHRLSTIAQMDRILVMEQGRIVEDGTHADLLAKRGLYAGFWNRQSGGFIDIDFEK
ncbi:MAG: ABC transporter ATP-binding protein [Paracoccaceae bacterium]|mgnify:FL=1|jgi:ATP-binding cassette subfamily B multidrug efflux pump|nr:ABC transporter ATP-binding protein [Marinovum sp.]MDC0540132.1 ABC transporter ATP-binding protein/permease [Paracoccaceae bacterium]MDG1258525.1 ABC transporter ATP-binding protein [Paracoccaceae bacterium]MDG1318365.1 ABC transporter ATP-binding protein [Paracoccaceae bacterium]MDG2068132.1 ABC transporter ATP-binding protein [Paracoccaceae bacterium]|tara:strand:- start:10 stop:1848 length:1839 start_codon:yes stop_codon:yes gene_type:complete